MTPKIFEWINISVTTLVAATLVLTAWFWLAQPSEIYPVSVIPKEPKMPANAFTQNHEDYDMIGEPFLFLAYTPMQMQLPDLQKYLTYFGKNARPDAKEETPLLHFSLNGSKAPVSVPSGEKVYLIYDRTQNPPVYVFSLDNKETSLWIEGTPVNGDVAIKVGMKDESNRLITKPASRASIHLKEKEYARFGGKRWELSKWRVDGTLLARQRARWYGKDLFLSRHGGDEYGKMVDKNRIDFGEGEEKYSVFVGSGDTLVWKNEQWHSVKPGPESLGYPLMTVKKIDNRIMNLELWDVDGKGKIALNLLKSNEAWMPQNIQKEFTYLGARTRSLFVFEVDEERMLIRPKDWLVFTDDGWRKLSSPEEIDDYVEGRLKGSLFVFDGVIKKNDQQMLEGTIYNNSRTAIHRVELPIQQGLANFTSISDDSNVIKIQNQKGHGIKSVARSFDDDDDDDDEKDD